jgi:hypothetical protein
MKTKICMLNGATKSDVNGFLEEAHHAAKWVADNAIDGFFPFNEKLLSIATLEQTARWMGCHNLVLWDTAVYTPDVPSGAVICMQDSAECGTLQDYMFILIGQGRFDLCCQADLTPAQVEQIGHICIDQHMVPVAFFGRVEHELRILDCSAGVKLNAATLFKPEFLQSLDAHEHAMLMPCTFRLVLAGVLNLPVVQLADDEEEATA